MAPKYKRGDMVFSWQNPNKKRRVSHLRDDGDGNYSYKVALMDKDGYSYSSKWMSEPSLTKRRTPQWLRENGFRVGKGRTN